MSLTSSGFSHLIKKLGALKDTPDKKEKLMTVKEVAEYLRLDEHTVYRMARKGELPAYKVAAKRIIFTLEKRLGK